MKTTFCILTLFFLIVLSNQLLAQDYALDFNGSVSSRYVYCQNLFVSGSAPRTVEAWVNPRTFTTNAGVFECGHGASGSGLINFGLRIGNADEWKVELHDETFIYNSTGTLNTWNHFALVYDGTNVKLYHNGNLVINVVKNLNTIQSSFLIGRLASGFFDGKIDEVRFWNVARSQEQIQSAMYTNLAGTENGLLAEYRMNEGTGTTTHNSSTRSDLNPSYYSNYLDAQIINNAEWTGGRTTEVISLIPTNITRYSATLRADVKYINIHITEIGICYGTSPLPLTSGNKITGSLTTGIFSGNITGLTSGTTYYYRPYVIQDSRVYYSGQLSFAAVLTAPTGSGNSLDDPIRVSDIGHLEWISDNRSAWDKIIYQEADIDASVTSSWPDGGWQPLGGNEGFSGQYYGNGHIISGLYINRLGSNRQGFIGSLFNGEVHDLFLKDVNIRGSQRVGALAGSLYGFYAVKTITNCYSSGVVKGGDIVGGLFGDLWDDNQFKMTIKNCFSTCTVEALGDNGCAGGLICAIMGLHRSLITDCYSRGNVSGAQAGGFAQTAELMTINNCYSTGCVNGTSFKGGFVAFNNGATFNNCYWDRQTSTITSSAGGTGLTTAEMKVNTLYISAGWDFNIWNMGDGINDGYPYLKWQYPVGTPLPVELSSFTAAAKTNKVTLNWKTETEVNSYGFNVERCKVQGTRYETWEKIGFVQGHGNSNSPKEYSFTDIPNGGTVFKYRLKQIDFDGQYEYSPEVEVVLEVPVNFSVKQNYPNPFNPTTKIEFVIPVDNRVLVKVYNVLGMELATLLNEHRQAGTHSIEFSANGRASNLASGIYFYKVVSGNYSEIKKMILLR